VAQEGGVKARLPWLGLALWAALTATGMALSVAKGGITDAALAPALTVFAAVGALLAARRPRNPIGWLLLAVAVTIALGTVVHGLYDDTGSPPRDLGTRTLLWADDWLFYVWVTPIGVLVPLLFPDGRLPSPRWRGFMKATLVVLALAFLSDTLGQRTLDWGTDAKVPNPYHVPGVLGDALGFVSGIGAVVFILACAGALVSLGLRLRRSTGAERLQFKWFALAMALLIVGLVTSAAGEITTVGPVSDAGWWLFISSLIVGLPDSIGVAVMRYRLYDIDLVINRALVYGTLTVTLGAAYLGSVLLVGLAVGRSGFAVAVSTLAVAALFRPLRARIQGAVDRRFYRRRYDAARTLEAFSARLRDEVDLAALSTELRGVVGETVQPAHVSLWLRGER
jgi:hypothetical protein